MDILPTDFYERWDSAARAAVEAKAQLHYLEHARHHILAKLSADCLVNGAKSVAQAEMQAKASKDYKAYLSGLQVAEVEAGVKAIEQEMYERKFDAWRTEQATKRVEAKL